MSTTSYLPPTTVVQNQRVPYSYFVDKSRALRAVTTGPPSAAAASPSLARPTATSRHVASGTKWASAFALACMQQPPPLAPSTSCAAAPSPSVVQGTIGNCWFVAALQAVWLSPVTRRSITQDGVLLGSSNNSNEPSSCAVRLWICDSADDYYCHGPGAWHWVVLDDDTVPALDSVNPDGKRFHYCEHEATAGGPMAAPPPHPSLFVAPLIERALATVLGGYCNLRGHHPQSSAYRMLLGEDWCPVGFYCGTATAVSLPSGGQPQPRARHSSGTHLDAEELFKLVQLALLRGWPLSCSSKQAPAIPDAASTAAPKSRDDLLDPATGLVTYHGHSIVDTRRIPNAATAVEPSATAPDRSGIAAILVRNVWPMETGERRRGKPSRGTLIRGAVPTRLDPRLAAETEVGTESFWSSPSRAADAVSAGPRATQFWMTVDEFMDGFDRVDLAVPKPRLIVGSDTDLPATSSSDEAGRVFSVKHRDGVTRPWLLDAALCSHGVLRDYVVTKLGNMSRSVLPLLGRGGGQ